MTKHFLAALLFIVYAQPAFSANLFGINISSNDFPDQPYRSFTRIQDLFDATKQTSIAQIPGYSQISSLDVEIKLGNSSAHLKYAANSSQLEFSMPNCPSVNRTFDSGTSNNPISRAANENNFRDYINSSSIQTKINKCLAATNQPNPITPFPVGCFLDCDSTSEEDQENFGIGLTIGYSSSGNLNRSILTLPLSYTHYYEEEGRKLKISAPISYVDINGSKAYKASLGLIYTRPINERWTVIPATRLGVTVSKDMGIAATVASAYLTNRYEFPYRNKHVTLANMVGIMTTVDIDIAGYKNNYDLNNQIIKNGIAVEFPQTFQMLGGKTSIQASLANTQFFGDEMKIDNYTDIAVSFGTRRKVGNKDNSQDSLQLGFTYTVGNHGYKGGKINFGYEF